MERDARIAILASDGFELITSRKADDLPASTQAASTSCRRPDMARRGASR